MSPPHNAAHSQHTMGPPVNERCSVIYNITSFQRRRGEGGNRGGQRGEKMPPAPWWPSRHRSARSLSSLRLWHVAGVFALRWVGALLHSSSVCSPLVWSAELNSTFPSDWLAASSCLCWGALLREGGCGWSSTVSGHPWTNWRNVDLNWQWKRRKISLCVVQCFLCLGLFAKLVSYIDFNPSHRNNCSILGRALFGVRANLSAKMGKCIISDTRADGSLSHWTLVAMLASWETHNLMTKCYKLPLDFPWQQ